MPHRSTSGAFGRTPRPPGPLRRSPLKGTRMVRPAGSRRARPRDRPWRRAHSCPQPVHPRPRPAHTAHSPGLWAVHQCHTRMVPCPPRQGPTPSGRPLWPLRTQGTPCPLGMPPARPGSRLPMGHTRRQVVARPTSSHSKRPILVSSYRNSQFYSAKDAVVGSTVSRYASVHGRGCSGAELVFL